MSSAAADIQGTVNRRQGETTPANVRNFLSSLLQLHPFLQTLLISAVTNLAEGGSLDPSGDGTDGN